MLRAANVGPGCNEVRCHSCGATAVLPVGTDHLGMVVGICSTCGYWYTGYGEDAVVDGSPAPTVPIYIDNLIPDDDRFTDLPEGL